MTISDRVKSADVDGRYRIMSSQMKDGASASIGTTPITKVSTTTAPPIVHPQRLPASAFRGRAALSAREVEVLRCWLHSDNKADVARQLYLSVGTVNTHLARIRAKYEATGRPAGNKAALVARALQDGLVRLDDL